MECEIEYGIDHKWSSVVPRPSLKSWKWLLCSEQDFLSRGEKNVMITFLYPELEFLTPPWIWTTIKPCLQKLKMAAKAVGTANNRLWDKIALPPIQLKIQSLTSCKYWSKHQMLLHVQRVWARDYKQTCFQGGPYDGDSNGDPLMDLRNWIGVCMYVA